MWLITNKLFIRFRFENKSIWNQLSDHVSGVQCAWRSRTWTIPFNVALLISVSIFFSRTNLFLYFSYMCVIQQTRKCQQIHSICKMGSFKFRSICVCVFVVCLLLFSTFLLHRNGCSVNFVQRCNVLHWTWTGCVIDNTNPLSHNYSHWFALIFELRVGMVAFTFSAEPAISLPFRYDTLVCFYWTVKIFGFSFTICFFLPNFVCLFCELEFVRPNHDMQW